MTGLMVTGTDTGVGKTCVGAALLRIALRRGMHPRPFKPVETGCDPEPRDAHLLWEAAGRPTPLADVCPFPLPIPAAPSAAARAAGLTLTLDDLVRRARLLASPAHFLLVEGAGGLLVPYAGRLTAADMAAQLGVPLLIVARTALGTINHTALTLSELARRRLPVAGLILVQTTSATEPHERWNAELIEEITGVRPFCTLPYLGADGASDPDCLADALSRALDPATLDRLLS